MKYWKRAPTLGLGVSAHELWGGRRRANVSALRRYVEELAAGRRPVASDAAVTDEESARERLVLGLRLAEGVPAGDVEGYIRASGYNVATSAVHGGSSCSPPPSDAKSGNA